MDSAPDRPRGPDLLRSPLLGALGALLLLVVAVVAVAGLVHGTSTTGRSGNGIAATSTRHVAPFTAIELAGSNLVVVRVGAPQAVRVRGDANLLRLVTTRVRRGTLVIDERTGFSTVAPMRVEVDVPSLDAVTLTGSGVVTASGRADRVDARLPGSGDLDLHGLVVRRATADVSGSGTIRLTVTGSLDARVSGSGAVLYRGSPEHVHRVVTGSGAVLEG